MHNGFLKDKRYTSGALGTKWFVILSNTFRKAKFHPFPPFRCVWYIELPAYCYKTNQRSMGVVVYIPPATCISYYLSLAPVVFRHRSGVGAGVVRRQDDGTRNPNGINVGAGLSVQKIKLKDNIQIMELCTGVHSFKEAGLEHPHISACHWCLISISISILNPHP